MLEMPILFQLWEPFVVLGCALMFVYWIAEREQEKYWFCLGLSIFLFGILLWICAPEMQVVIW